MKPGLFSIFPNQCFLDLYPYQYGYCENDSDAFFGPAARNHYLFHYVISGAGRLYAPDTTGKEHIYSIKSGQGFLIFPHQITTYYADEKYPWEYIWIEFDGLHAEEAILQSGLSMENPIYHPSSRMAGLDLYTTMDYIVHHPNASSFELISKLYLFIHQLVRSSSSYIPYKSSSQKTKYNSSLKQATAFVEQNFYNNISVEDIAAACNIHRNYLGKIFKENLNTTPQRFLISYRMKKAVDLLEGTKLSIKEIAKAVGYENPFHFSRTFKRLFSVSPKHWRETKQLEYSSSQKK